MAEPSPSQQLPQPQPEPSQFWCYQCEKRVSTETLADLNVICYDCKNGFVVSIDAPPPTLTPRPPTPPPPRNNQETSFSHQFLQVLRLMAQAAREDDGGGAPPPPPPPAPPATSLVVQNGQESDDFLRIELDGWENDEDDIEFGENVFHRSDSEIGGDDDEEEEIDEQEEHDQDDDDASGDDGQRHRDLLRRDVLRHRIRDIALRAAGRNRYLDWSEILMGLEDNAIELRVEMSDSDRYIGNPEDYVDAAGYEALLQNLAESDGASGIRGPPPASKAAVSGLSDVVIGEEEEGGVVCAVCKEVMPVGDVAKKLPCGHGYHGECIVPWLGSRNSCPVCRFELPTDDAEYEEEKMKKKNRLSSTSISSSGGGGSSGSRGSNNGVDD